MDQNTENGIDVLLSITSDEPARKTFFSCSTYTASIKCTVSFYANVIHESMKEFGDIQNVCGVTSENSRVCVIAKE